MFKLFKRAREVKREELPWTRLKRGPGEEDEVITETKRDAGEWTRLKKETGEAGNNSDDGARTKKGRERAVISFTDWEDVGWIRMM